MTLPATSCHVDALLAAERERAVTPTNQPLSAETNARVLEAAKAFSSALPDLPTSTQEGV